MQFIKSMKSKTALKSTSSKSRRELTCLAATAINANRFPILAAHWPSLLIVDGRLACHDNAPVADRFVMETANG